MAKLLNTDSSINNRMINRSLYTSCGNKCEVNFSIQYDKYIPDIFEQTYFWRKTDHHLTAFIRENRTYFTLMCKDNFLLLIIHDPVISIEVDKDIDVLDRSDMQYIENIVIDKVEKYNLLQ